MGKSQATQSILQQLDQARFKKLCESANSLLSQPIQLPAKPPLALLMKILNAVAAEKFKSEYNYDFEGDFSKPPDVAGDATLNIGSAENICSIKDANEIPPYVALLLNSAEPSWARKPAGDDIVNQGNTILRATPEDSFHTAFINKSYAASKPEDNWFSIDAVLVYCTIKVDNKQYAIIYFAGVYFQVLSPKKLVENRLLDNLIELANKLLEMPVPIPSPQSIQTLETILRIHGKKIFGDQFGYPYQGDETSPNDKLPGAGLHAADAICIIKDDEPGVVESFVKNILNVIPLPNWAQGQGTALLNEAKGLLKVNTANGWNHAFFVRSIDNPTPRNSSSKTTSVFVYANGSINDLGVTVKISFIYYLGVYYGTYGPYAIARNALLANLCKTAADLVPDHIPTQVPPTIQDLDKILNAHGLLQFKSDFSFPYEGDQTKPDDLVKNTQAQGISVLLYVENRNADALNDAVQFKILQNVTFPSWAQEHTSTMLQRYMGLLIKGAAGFGWKTLKFSDPVAGKSNSFKTIASLTYANANRKEGDIELTYSFIYFVGVFYLSSIVRVGEDQGGQEVKS